MHVQQGEQIGRQRDIIEHQFDTISRRDDRIDALTATNRALNQQIRRWKAYAQKLEKQLVETKKRDPLALQRVGNNTRQEWAWLTPRVLAF